MSIIRTKVFSGMPLIEFGRQLVKTADLDPLYVLLAGAKMPREKLCRWLVAYWCYYHAGLCCWIVDQHDYWAAMFRVAYGRKDYPRGTERRHFRGELAVNSIAGMRSQFDTAQDVVDWLLQAGPSASGIMERSKRLHGFGEWIKWKIPDMIERLGLAKVQFVEENLNDMFSSSLQGAALFADQMGLEKHPLTTKLVYSHRAVLKGLSGLKAPPRYDRPLNVQETETIFCKWKSHLGGHYPTGKDTREIRHGLLRYARSRTAQDLLKVWRSVFSVVLEGD